ncbi:MAG: right-handed parallel beta-helix repeat-containing protein, partial [Armatimonadota bacterium]
MARLIVTLSISLLAAGAAHAAVEFHVASGGNDASTGSAEAPFATLVRARDAVREASAEDAPHGGVTVWLHGGRHEMAETLELSAEDSGAEDTPVTWRARPGEDVVLSGGRRVPSSAWGPVTDTAVLGRLPEESRRRVVQADLRALGVEDFGSPAGGGLEVFFGEERMTLARWPNDGFTRIAELLGVDPIDVRAGKGDRVGKFVFEGDRPLRWAGEKDLWVHGYWFHDWSDGRHRVKRIDRDGRTIEVEEPYHNYGYRKGQWYYAYNALSELDEPGEWYLDRETGLLYLWPPGEISESTVTVSVADRLISVRDASHITFDGLVFEATRGTAAVIGGAHNSLIGCTFRDIGGFAASVSGSGHRIMHCDAYALGEGGFRITGGDRKTLTPGDIVVENCHIHDFGEWKRMYVPGVHVSGVGHRVAHNLIHTAPHQAIGFSGNDHIFERNEIHSVCYESNDAGAIYSGRNWTMRGTVIRHNYMHHVNGREGRASVGVYLDDMYCGTEISGNVFYRVIRAAFIGGGRDNLVFNNVFAECPRAIHIDARALGWAAGSVSPTMTTRLKEMPYENELWSARYPNL